MSTAGANGAAYDAAVDAGPPPQRDSTQLDEALAELSAAQHRLDKVTVTYEAVKADYDGAIARVEALQNDEV